MKRKFESEFESDSGDESDEGEEPIIQLVLQDLPGSVSQEQASNLLHSMAASKNILFWTPGGELIRNQRRIPDTSITELLEYVLLPFNSDIRKPRALNSFLAGLAELGINKSWIENKKALSDIIEEEEDPLESESSGEEEEEEEEEEDDDDDDNEDSDDDEDSENDDENDIEKKPKKSRCDHCQSNDVEVKRTAQCPKCHWEDVISNSSPNLNDLSRCSICNIQFPLTNETAKNRFTRCNQCNTLSHILNEEKRDYELE